MNIFRLGVMFSRFRLPHANHSDFNGFDTDKSQVRTIKDKPKQV